MRNLHYNSTNFRGRKRGRLICRIQYPFTIKILVDAFVILGGNPDKSGTINKSQIIKVIKEDFELTFDIEEFLDK